MNVFKCLVMPRKQNDHKSHRKQVGSRPPVIFMTVLLCFSNGNGYNNDWRNTVCRILKYSVLVPRSKKKKQFSS